MRKPAQSRRNSGGSLGCANSQLYQAQLAVANKMNKSPMTHLTCNKLCQSPRLSTVSTPSMERAAPNHWRSGLFEIQTCCLVFTRTFNDGDRSQSIFEYDSTKKIFQFRRMVHRNLEIFVEGYWIPITETWASWITDDLSLVKIGRAHV